MTNLSQKHLLNIGSLSDKDINLILNLADGYAAKLEDHAFKTDVLSGKTVMALFFENSTRTRVSFEMAAKRLGADWINIDIEHSAVKKGESLQDTIATLQKIVCPDAIIVRHSKNGTAENIANYVDCPVINAGDGTNQHPTQALLDALTIQQNLETITGLTSAICGDVAHSRVAGSNVELLTKLGANVRIVIPENTQPPNLPIDNISVFKTMKEGLQNCDIVMMLRIQKERYAEGLILLEEDFLAQYGLTSEKLKLAKPEALIMHPGPMNRNIEIADDVADDPKRSLILKQVANSVPTRMAVLELLLNNND